MFDAAEQARYRVEKEARRGAEDYMAMDGDFARYLDDPYSGDRVEREALTDECEVLIVGAGFAGLMLWHKLRAAGIVDVRVCEKGGDVGGTWYWNRYPGVACDVESYSYLPLLEETGYVPSMKFASGFEILEYCQSMAERLRVLRALSVPHHRRPHRVGRDHAPAGRCGPIAATPCGPGTSCWPTASSPAPSSPGSMGWNGSRATRSTPRDGTTTSRWRAVGSASSAPGPPPFRPSPSWPRSSASCSCSSARPSTIDVRDQRATTDEERATWADEPGWARARRARFAKISAGRTAIQANDDYLAGQVADFKERKQYERELTPEELTAKQLDSNFRIMEQIRARVDAIVEDPATAAALKPWYPYGCKRPTFHDEYLPTFNRPNVHLVDTAPRGVPRDQRAWRRPRRRRVPARRVDLRHRIRVDGGVDVQHDRGSRRPLA